MKNNRKIYLLLFFIITGRVVFGQCVITLVTSTTNTACSLCTNGTASASVSGGTAPYTYVWTNNVTPGVIDIVPSKDNSIYEQTMTNSNGAGQYLVAGETNAGFKNRALIKFNIAGNIPANASVSNVSLKMTVFNSSGASGPQNHELHKVLQDWGEGASASDSQPGQGAPATSNDATWLKNFYPASDWTNPGGTFNSSISAVTVVSSTVPSTPAWSSSQMTADVQSWLNNPSLNYGWLFKSDETGNRQARRYGSRENVVSGGSPLLTVNYGPAILGNTNSISNLASGTYTMTVTDVNGCTATASATVGVETTTTNSNMPVATTYRGAFAPAPTPMWTDNWTNWDPNNAYYPATNVTVTGHITTNQTWTHDNVYLVSGIVSVDSLVTLTIEAGTIVRGNEQVAGSVLVVRRGAQLIANGTPCNPIVFTSNKAAGSRVKGDWGGVILLGKGINNLGTTTIEGIDPVNNIQHGGTDPNDNSGSMKYCRIEFAGFQYQVDNEINGLTFGSVGAGTTIDYIQVSFSNDDSYEWFGGSVNCSHLVAYRGLDDDWDTDNGFSGLVQFGLSVRDPQISDLGNSTSEGFESDNDASGSANLPLTSARFYNITQIGAFRCGSNAGTVTTPPSPKFQRGARIRRNSALRIYNSILMNNWIGYFNDLANAASEFRNNILAMDTTAALTGVYAPNAKVAQNAASYAFLATQVPANTIVNNPCDILANAWDFLNPDYRPNSASGSGGGLLAGCDLTPGFSIGSPLFTANASQDFLVNVTENNIGTSNGVVTVRLIVPGGWTVSVPGLTLTTTPQAGTDGSNGVGAYTNSKWQFSRNASSTQVIATLNVGLTIPQNATSVLGFTATRKATTPNGTNQNLSGSVSGGSDNNAGNNSKTLTFGAN